MRIRNNTRIGAFVRKTLAGVTDQPVYELVAHRRFHENIIRGDARLSCTGKLTYRNSECRLIDPRGGCHNAGRLTAASECHPRKATRRYAHDDAPHRCTPREKDMIEREGQ